eukprot:1159890-Pelagomonas_calceolata.AAC.7
MKVLPDTSKRSIQTLSARLLSGPLRTLLACWLAHATHMEPYVHVLFATCPRHSSESSSTRLRCWLAHATHLDPYICVLFAACPKAHQKVLGLRMARASKTRLYSALEPLPLQA